LFFSPFPFYFSFRLYLPNGIKGRELIRFFISYPSKDYLRSNKLVLIVTILLKAFLIKVSLYS